MGLSEIELTFDNLWAATLGKLLLTGETIELLAKNGTEPEKVSLRGVENHKIEGATHTFETLITDSSGSHHGTVTAIFKAGNISDMLSGKMIYHLYPSRSQSE